VRHLPDGDGPLLIGQKVAVSIECSAGTISNITWTVSGIAVRDYVVVNDPVNAIWTATLTHLDSDYLSQQTIVFYWATPGKKKVEVTYLLTVDGDLHQCTQNMSFDIQAPEFATTFPTKIGVPTSTNSPSPGVILQGGDNPNWGIMFSANVKTPTAFGVGGIWQFTQTLSQAAFSRTRATGLCDETTSPEFQQIIDGAFSYPIPEVGPFSADGTTHSTSDSPAQFADPTLFDQISRESGFHTYIIYRPPGASDNTIWVPLRTISWQVQYCAFWGIITPRWIVSQNNSAIQSWVDYPSHPVWITQAPYGETTAHGQPCPSCD